MASAFSALAPAAAPKVPGMSYVNLSARQRMLSQRMLLQTVLAVQGDRRQFDAAHASLALFSESQVLLETWRAIGSRTRKVLPCCATPTADPGAWGR